MLIIDPNVRSTCPFKFAHAVRTSKNVSAYELHDKGRMGNIPFEKGDWLVKENGKFKIVPRVEFRTNYNTKKYDSPQWDKKRIPAMITTDDIDTEVVAHGAKGKTTVRRAKCRKGTYFVDRANEASSRAEEPFAYIVFQDPEEREIQDGVFVEDVLHACMDFMERQEAESPPYRQRQLRQVRQQIAMAAINATGHGIGIKPQTGREKASERRERNEAGRKAGTGKKCKGCK